MPLSVGSGYTVGDIGQYITPRSEKTNRYVNFADSGISEEYDVIDDALVAYTREDASKQTDNVYIGLHSELKNGAQQGVKQVDNATADAAMGTERAAGVKTRSNRKIGVVIAMFVVLTCGMAAAFVVLYTRLKYETSTCKYKHNYSEFPIQ